jgi:hypothetical protein
LGEEDNEKSRETSGKLIYVRKRKRKRKGEMDRYEKRILE